MTNVYYVCNELITFTKNMTLVVKVAILFALSICV